MALIIVSAIYQPRYAILLSKFWTCLLFSPIGAPCPKLISDILPLRPMPNNELLILGIFQKMPNLGVFLICSTRVFNSKHEGWTGGTLPSPTPLCPISHPFSHLPPFSVNFRTKLFCSPNPLSLSSCFSCLYTRSSDGASLI